MQLDNHQQLHHIFVEPYIDQEHTIEKESSEINLSYFSGVLYGSGISINTIKHLLKALSHIFLFYSNQIRKNDQGHILLQKVFFLTACLHVFLVLR